MKRRLLASAVLALVIAVAWATYLLRAGMPLAGPVDIEVTPGETPGAVARRLADRGIVRSPHALVLLARLRGVDRSIRHGMHRFEGRPTPNQVLDELLRNPQPTVQVTIPEGLGWQEIARLLEANDIVAADEYRAAVCDPVFLSECGADDEANCGEGYLFPDTYRLAPGMSAAEIARLQLQRFRQVSEELLARLRPDDGNALLAQLGGQGRGRPWQDPASDAHERVLRDAVVLASIIEKETSRPDERPLIASVFHNRLRRGMRLQADPTVIYGLAVAGTPWDGKRLSRYLRQPAPYNTYTRDGLPPGPISNPGRGALEAALFPAATDYLYFVADGSGAHRFSATLAEHNKAVAQLRRR